MSLSNTYQESLGIFNKYNITLKDIASLAYKEQQCYYTDLTMAYAEKAVKSVLSKREVYFSLLVAYEIDHRAQQGNLHSPLQELVESDEGAFGVDETMAVSVAGLYGSIAVSNFGHLDKDKPDIIGKINKLQREQGIISTMIDDMVCAIVACAEGYIVSNFNEKD